MEEVAGCQLLLLLAVLQGHQLLIREDTVRDIIVVVVVVLVQMAILVVMVVLEEETVELVFNVLYWQVLVILLFKEILFHIGIGQQAGVVMVILAHQVVQMVG
jgi:hypothetical protein